MELRKSESMDEIPSLLSTTSQLDQEGDPSLSSDNSTDSDIFQSKRYKFMCEYSVVTSESNKIKKFNIFVETVNSIPQPHHRANMVCYVCDDMRIFQENGDYDTRSSILNQKYRGKEYWIEGSIFDKSHRPNVTRTRWIKPVLEAAREGCCLCTLVVQAVAALGKGHFEDSPLSVCLKVKDIGGVQRYSIGQSQWERPSVIELYRNAYEPTSCGLSLPFITTAQEVSNSLPESLQTAKSWIANCETHRRCNLDDIGGLKIPTRVIDVGISNVSVKLIETKNLSGSFAALSYCWGDSTILEDIKLTHAKLSVYKKRIPMDSLPKTLFDAVMITRELGIPYLWIDSLCIMQDSLKDWQIESSRMSDVYMSAFLVLAATEARDPNGGFFLENRTKSLKLPYLDADNCQYFLYARRIQTQFSVHDANGRLESHGLHNSELRRRGWVLQEQVLAKRTLSFAKDEMLWDCRECSTCECRTGFSNFESETSFLNMYFDFKLQSSPIREAYKNIYSNWYTMVEDYSHRSLTYQTDKLPAISGIVKLLHDMTQDDYYAGLWRSQLPDAFLWTAEKFSEDDTESEKRLPSWSWASIRSGGITYDHKDKEFKAGLELVSVGIQISGSNAFGGVLGGKLEVKAVLIPINAMGCEPYSISAYEATEPKEKKWALWSLKIRVNLDPYYYDPKKPTESAIEVEKYDSLFLMFVGTLKSEEYAENPSFLALKYLEEDERGNSIFMRAGIALVDASMKLLDRVRAGTKESIVLI
ncbi:uncharacterized protein EAE98_001454 [Botrytis deweyae]|uniref:Heterokaryon incompatibility domain-containing protein n=1 Tax=Botrytis deweyae TaxID=2478750 RepID=A0ABQ7IXX4_9HELO|nr:uncharacterized protein EAE98_001454 [Botrytis deweyae]KAF7937140.1 hypothetical protein EAE98_001454 [Botrytis deweyae]